MLPQVNAAMGEGAAQAERALALSYAAAGVRGALEALFALDDRLAAIVRAARDPMVGQMRLTWWYEALIALDSTTPPAEPVLSALHAALLPGGVSGRMLAEMIDGWELLIDGEPLDAEALSAYGAARGGTLFAAAARICGADAAQPRSAGEGWALADLAIHLRDPEEGARAKAMAGERIDVAFRQRWAQSTRALGGLALLARFDLMAEPPPKAGPRRVLRLLRHRWNGT